MAKRVKKVQKPKLVTKSYTLIADVTISGKLLKKGTTVKLTKEGLI